MTATLRIERPSSPCRLMSAHVTLAKAADQNPLHLKEGGAHRLPLKRFLLEISPFSNYISSTGRLSMQTPTPLLILLLQ